MIDFHLLGEILFEPFVFLDVLIDELDGQLSVNLYSCFTCFAVVEPCLCPPSDATLIGIDANQSRYVETLYVYLQFGKRIDKAAAGYGCVIGFFFTAWLMLLRKI